MKKQLSISLALLLPALCGGAAASANAFSPKTQQSYFRYAPKAKAPNALFASQAKAAAKAAPAPGHSFTEADDINWLEGPDGSTWFCTINYQTEEVPVVGGYGQTESLIKGWEFSIYDSEFKLVGTVKDMVDLAEDETRVAAVEISSVITRKFFNFNDNCEIIVGTACNSANYTVNYRSYAYSIGGKKDADGYDEPLCQFDGYMALAFNNAQDRWSEDFYIGFLTETSNPELDDRLEYLHSIKNVVNFYKKAGWGSEPGEYGHIEVQMASLPGDQEATPFAVEYNHDGKWGLALSHYEKPLFIDPAPQPTEDDPDPMLVMTPDNNLVIELYTPGYDSFELQQTTRIPVIHDSSKHVATFYGIGSFRYDGDINFGDIDTQNPDKAAFMVTRQTLAGFNDDYEYTLQQYDSEGQLLNTVIEGMENYVMMSDLKGFEPQCMFIKMDPQGGDYTFDMIDLYSGRKVATLPHYIDGMPVTASVDRVRVGDSYNWVFAAGTNRTDTDRNILESVLWVNTDGELNRIDELNIGRGVAYAQVYINSDALDPFLFNTDADQEYMYLVKRYADNSYTATTEELLIVSANGGTLMTIEPDEVRGDLRLISLFNGKQLAVAYLNMDTDEFTQEFYSLPLSSFAGGDGTAANPYQIATAGDLRLISREPGANYILVDDIDMKGYEYQPMQETFSGSLDGQGKFIKNLSLASSDTQLSFLGSLSQNASVKNINFLNASLQYDDNADLVGLISATAMGAKIDNVHAYGLTITGPDDSYPTLGGLVGKATNYASITNSSVVNGDIASPEGQIGGIVGSMLTASTVRACAYVGQIRGNDNVGGIVGELYAAESSVLNCHVNAEITANNTVGGIAGSSNRGTIANCVVEGSVKALAPNRWNNAGPCAGGIAGNLKMAIASESDSDDTPAATDIHCIRGNYVNLSLLEGFDCPEEQWPGQYSTIHRIVGRTALNINPEDTDNELVEEGLADNYANAAFSAIHDSESFKAMEGESADDDTLNAEFFTARGFKYGSDVENPWQSQPEWRPTLHHEANALALTKDIESKVDRMFTASVLFVSRVPMTEEDVLGSLVCEFDETLLEMTGNYSYAANTLNVEFRCLAEGETELTLGAFDKDAKMNVNILASSGVGNIEAAGNDLAISFDGSAVSAEACLLNVYSVSGQLAASGTDRVSVESLPAGIYLVRASDAAGRSASAKIAVK